ncbi:hypothetical protein N7466_006380 [Penicillium verhagenii]|uniref:uncharacterized protein n=1 Tax=Penicillium verhagenii TaxID=1562060 RepID=UPI002544E859|nr:uncharacterized protein N7466_006380 [Penicillium verhagenii]KAJ5930887.1 hypothetical protein N7466_006380 [Penicillium verhagenii]
MAQAKKLMRCGAPEDALLKRRKDQPLSSKSHGAKRLEYGYRAGIASTGWTTQEGQQTWLSE